MTDLQITDVTATPEYQRLKEDFIRVEMSRSHWENMARNYEKQHIDDIHKIGKALIAEAESRGWCDQYDQFVDKLNDELNRSLEVREHEYTIEVEYKVRIQREVSGTSYDSALELLRDDVERELRAIDDADYDFDSDTDYS